MFAVIFKARLKKIDDEYTSTAKMLRELAKNYGCVDFISSTEGDMEIAISYWESEEQIKQWKMDPEHIKAQQLGKSRWYGSYKIEIVEIKREYSQKP